MPESSKQPGGVIPAVLITLLAAFGIGVSIPRSAPEPAAQAWHTSGASTAGQSSPAGAFTGKHSAFELLSEFLATDQQEETAPLQGAEPDSGELRVGQRRPEYHLKFAIATLPVPVSAALRSSFDYDLNAITAAASDNNYTLDNFDLPWTDAAKANPQAPQPPSEIDVFGTLAMSPAPSAGWSPSPAGPTPQLRLKAEDVPAPRWETQPGLILFRGVRSEKPSQDKRHELLLLFIVGETPTRGINKKAMREALNEITLRGIQPGNLPTTIAGRWLTEFNPDVSLTSLGQSFRAPRPRCTMSWSHGLRLPPGCAIHLWISISFPDPPPWIGPIWSPRAVPIRA